MIQSSRSGFTFIELVIAIAIIGILTAGGIGLYSYVAQAKKKTTLATLKQLKTVIATYREDVGKLPTTLEDLVRKPTDVTSNKWSKFIDEDEAPKDGWGFEFVYKATPDQKHKYELYSYGGPEGEEEPEENHLSVWG